MAERRAHEARWRGPAHEGGDDDLLGELPEAHAQGQQSGDPSTLQAAWVFGWPHRPADCQCAVRRRQARGDRWR
eukprot:3376539-Alexandrium_andersonii.AAC.1